ncbi:MAG TPA: V-type ATPase subunit [Vicinamibacterales bacterium]|nr:V-type ATPase subunit [Vicinamibacterales bacterium]
MRAPDVALVARARGIGVHLVPRPALEDLAGAGDLASFGRGLRRLGSEIDPVGDASDITSVEQAIGRTAARHVRTLARWDQRRPGQLDALVADQDRRTLRAILRGAAQGAPSARRLEGLMPTRWLPARAIAELARQPSAAAVVKQLVWLRHPYAPRLLPLVRQAHPDLLAVEVALLQGFADRATAAAAHGDRHLREFVRERVDLGNAQNALLLAGGPRDVAPDGCFVGGGRWLARSPFVAAASAVSAERALAVLRNALADSPLVSWLPPGVGDASHVERAYFGRALRHMASLARREPLSSAVLLWIWLRLEAQTRDLRSLAWGAALGTPQGLRVQALVTPS